ncbi:MAG TPA: aminodeoxychorismate/anthranilate synthase component II [Polyangiaceae bacterium]|nr:aminodeoxychorismate/anthranilate synthase component II [Polyangiaceae bacterium]
MARTKVVVVDNYDSFTWNLVQYLEELGASCDVRRNDETTAEEVLRSMPRGVVISPGPGTPEDAGVTLDVIRDAGGRVPLLGVCLGHQAIGLHFGADVRRAAHPVHGRASPVSHDGRGVFAGLSSPLVCGRYHSLALDPGSLPAELVRTAVSEDGEIMGIRHAELPIEGIQFHPESILSEQGHALLENWLSTL